MAKAKIKVTLTYEGALEIPISELVECYIQQLVSDYRDGDKKTRVSRMPRSFNVTIEKPARASDGYAQVTPVGKNDIINVSWLEPLNA